MIKEWLSLISENTYRIITIGKTLHQKRSDERIKGGFKSCKRLKKWDERWFGGNKKFVPRRLLFDYYCKNSRRHCVTIPPGIFCDSPQIWLKPTKPLGPNGFPVNCLMTPTSSLNPTELLFLKIYRAMTLKLRFVIWYIYSRTSYNKSNRWFTKRNKMVKIEVNY